MAADAPDAARPIESMDDLLVPFFASEKPRGAWQIGTEAEKFGVFADGATLPFEGERSVATVLARLAERHGWVPEGEFVGGTVIALRRGRASITLEPAGQLELSGAPLDTIHETRVELLGHLAEVRAVSADLGIRWLGLGFHPFASHADLPWVPKLRYGVMREYLPTKGRFALDMMRRTCTVQANLDYASADDAFRKLRVALRAQPIVSAMFANSPWVEGRATGERSRRVHVWTSVDPDRQGLLPQLWEGPASYERYVEWALDVPMFLVKRGSTLHRNTGQTFRDYWENGFEGLRATIGDWDTHLNTLFPEARLKRTLEVRGADAQGADLLVALPAFWKGLLYDETSLAGAEGLLGALDFESLEAARPAIGDRGLGATLVERPVAAWASELVTLAREGLARLGNLDCEGRDETHHLEALEALVAKGESPACEALRRAPGASPSPEAVLDAVAL
ncbi:MAG: glutamate--cysteine ligase [Myxococcales bacterium]|nr:glutamate--cysteine ligase [Myxococcales bacterium]